jgi:predicted NBD/HSP70 family sugar kinase
VGIAVPTTLDADDTLEPCFNLPTLGRFPLRRVAAEKLDREVRLENDANCYALGEWLFGAGRGARLLAGITLGTGIGVGLIRDGTILSGAHGRAGEIWRSPVHLNPADEAAGCLEDIASGMGLQKAYRARTGGWTDGERIAALARRGDAAASEVFAVFGRVLGSAIRWIVDLVDPDRIVLGGSVAGSMDLFAEELFRAAGCDPRMIVRGTTGEGAALFGAAALALEPEEKPA